MITRILFYFSIFLFIHILPSWSYEFEGCCSNELATTTTNTTHLLTCPLNFVIKIHSAIFYTGNGCERSACQKRLNKYYLSCNNHRTCSISIRCILMDSSTCPWLSRMKSYSQHIVIDYDCVLHKSESPSLTLNNKTQKEQNDNVVLFSAKVNIESPSDLSTNDSILTDEEQEWKEYFLRKYFYSKQLNEDKTIIIHEQRSLLNEILRTVLILIIFTFILILFMIVTLFLYKRMASKKQRKLFGQDKHQPFPPDDAYDNIKATRIESASDSGTTTDV